MQEAKRQRRAIAAYVRGSMFIGRNPRSVRIAPDGAVTVVVDKAHGLGSVRVFAGWDRDILRWVHEDQGVAA